MAVNHRNKPGSKGRRKPSASSARRGGSGKAKAGGKGGRKPSGQRGRNRSGSSGRPRRADSASRSQHRRKGGGHAGPTRNTRNRRPAREPSRKAPYTGVGPDNLPRWLRDEVRDVTRRDRQAAALRVLAEALDAFGDDEFGAALHKLRKAKKLSPRASPVREYLGLSAYHSREWSEALAEFRAYRRLTGDTTYMPFEMDTLRALERNADVDKTWERFVELGGGRQTDAEARVVYGSYLLDQGRVADAWRVTGPSRVHHDARPYELRVWFVAARAALALGESGTAAQLTRAIRRVDPDMSGLGALMARIATEGRRSSRG